MEQPEPVVQHLDEQTSTFACLCLCFCERAQEKAEWEDVCHLWSDPHYKCAAHTAEVLDDCVHIDLVDDAQTRTEGDGCMHAYRTQVVQPVPERFLRAATQDELERLSAGKRVERLSDIDDENQQQHTLVGQEG